MQLTFAKIKEIFRRDKALAVILFLSFFLSLSYSFYFRIEPAVDARAYDNIGWNLASGQGYREDLTKDIAYDASLTRVGPLYQFFLAGIYKIFGHRYEPVWLAQAWLHALSAWLVYLIASLVFSANDYRRSIGLWAAAIFGWYPDLIEISAMLLTETLYLFLVCLMVYLFFWYWDRQDYWAAALLGLSSGLAVLARSPVLFFIPVILFYFYKKNKIKQGILFLFILVSVFVPWTVRNYDVYREFLPLGGSGAFNFWIGNYHGGRGEQEPTAEHGYFVDNMPMAGLQDESMRQFKVFLRDYPAEFVKISFLRANKYFSLIRPMGWWFYQTGWGQIVFVFSSAMAIGVLFIMGFAGFIKSLKLKDLKVYYLAAFTAITPLILFATVVESRYRFQIYPLLAIFAGFYLVDFIKTKRLDRYFWLALLILMANSSIDFIISWGKFKGRITHFF